MDGYTWLDNESSEAVSLFWKNAGEPEDFPRNLERPLAIALPIALVKMPKLYLRDVETWLRLRGVLFSFQCESRAVRGCLVASGKGVIFIEGSDPNDELRFTIAHEIAHFLNDYWIPRQKAVSKLGNSITSVIDGLRSPTVNERLYSVLGGLNIGIFINFMDRSPASEAKTWKAENQADKIALGLLAPSDAVLKKAELGATRFSERLESITKTLIIDFGLPKPVALFYGIELLNSIGKGRSWVETIRHS
jgi:hypothetical protein